MTPTLLGRSDFKVMMDYLFLKRCLGFAWLHMTSKVVEKRVLEIILKLESQQLWRLNGPLPIVYHSVSLRYWPHSVTLYRSRIEEQDDRLINHLSNNPGCIGKRVGLRQIFKQLRYSKFWPQQARRTRLHSYFVDSHTSN